MCLALQHGGCWDSSCRRQRRLRRACYNIWQNSSVGYSKYYLEKIQVMIVLTVDLYEQGMIRSKRQAPTSSRRSRLSRCGRTTYQLREWPCRKRSRSSKGGRPSCWRDHLCHDRLPCSSHPYGMLRRWILLLRFLRCRMSSTGLCACDSRRFQDSIEPH